MRSTFRVLFYTKNQAIKNGRVPVMGRITVNGTTASFSCKRDVPLALWDAKGNCAKGKSEEARRLNRELENIKAQIGKHYQYLSDHDSFLTAKKVYDRYNGFWRGDPFVDGDLQYPDPGLQTADRQDESPKHLPGVGGRVQVSVLLPEGQVGYGGYPPDVAGHGFHQELLQLDAFRARAGQVNGLRARQHVEMVDVPGNGRGWIHKHPFKKFVCKPEYKKRPFLSEEDLQRVISVKLSYRRQQAIRDMFVFMCFSGLAHADLKELSYRNVHTDSDGNTWLVGNRVKTKAPYVVKLLPIAVELIEKYRGVNEFKVSPDRVFPVGEIGSMEDSLKRIGEKAGCSVRVSPHVGRHTFATLALSKGMPLETLQKVLGHKTIISTQVYAS